MLQVNLEEAKDRLLELVDAVLKGETVLKTFRKPSNWCLWSLPRAAGLEVQKD